MDSLNLKIAKLILENDNQSATGDIFVAQPEDDLEARFGIMFGLVEIFNLPMEFTDKFFEIISDCHTEYYLPPFDPEQSVSRRFEECLQRVNRRVSKSIKESVAVIEPRCINAIIGLIHRDKIYLSKTGKNNALLFHQQRKYDHRLVDIFGETGEKKQKIDPEKIFAHVINGETSSKDRLIFFNEGILECLSLHEIMNLVTEQDATQAANEIKQILKIKDERNNFYAIIIQPTINEEKIKYQTQKLKTEIGAVPKIPTQNSINRLINTQENTERYLTPSLMPNWKKIAILTWRLIKKTSIYLKAFALMTIKLFGNWAKTIKNNLPRWLKALKKTGQIAIKEPKEITQKLTDHSWLTAKKITQKNVVPTQEIFADYNKKDGLMKKISHWLNRQIAKFISLNRLQQTALIIAFILIFLFSQSIVWQGQRTQTFGEYGDFSELIKQIEETINAAEAQNIFNDQVGAKNSISRAREMIEQITEQKKYQDIKEELNQKIEKISQMLQKVVYLESPEIIYNLINRNPNAQTQTITMAGGQIFVYDNQNQTIYQINPDTKEAVSWPLASQINEVRKIVSRNDKNLILLNQEGQFFQYNFDQRVSQNILMVNNLVADFDFYGNRLYTLQPDRGQIFRHTAIDTGFNSGNTWLRNYNAGQGALLSIDGGIYLVENDGQIKYFTTGQLATITFSPVEPALKSIKQLATNQESNYLYFLEPENQRIVVFDKRGNLKIQYTSKNFNQMRAITIAEPERKIYLLADNKIFMIEMSF